MVGKDRISDVDFLTKHGKFLANSGPSGFYYFLLSVLALPFWLFLLAPFALLTYPLKFFGKKPKAPKALEPLAAPEQITPLAERKYDLVLYGATGFTGQLCAQYLIKQYGNSIKWAVAGRNQAALVKVLAEANKKASTDYTIDILVGDSSKPDSLRPIVDNTRVLISTVGPFDLYGTPVVNLCAVYGTSYCDITGESDWVRKMIDNFDATAKSTGARIVHFCGHDCVPWDLAVYSVAKELSEKFNQKLTKVDCYDEILGAGSGGTFATLLHSLSGRVQYKSQLGYDPLMKPADGMPATAKGASVSSTDPKNQSILSYNKKALGGLGAWVGPFVMAMVMANCIRRSNAVNQYSGDNKLRYYEGRIYPSFFAGFVDLVYMIIFGTCLQSPVLTDLLYRFVLPKPGEGPSDQLLSDGFLRLTAVGTGNAGAQVQATIYFDNDPGYKDTARMLVESGLALALNAEEITVGGGVWTPAACQKETLLKRLVATGTKFEIKALNQ